MVRARVERRAGERSWRLLAGSNPYHSKEDKFRWSRLPLSYHRSPALSSSHWRGGAAIKAVKRQLQAQGRKIAYMSQRGIVASADEYLAQHRHALLAETWQRVCSAPELRELYERGQRKRQRLLERISANMNGTRMPDSQAISPCRNPLAPLPLVVAQEPPHADTPLRLRSLLGLSGHQTGKPYRWIGRK